MADPVTAPDLAVLLARCEALEAERNALRAENQERERLYADLLYQVENKVPGESRHETARRIIREHECHSAEAAPQTDRT